MKIDGVYVHRKFRSFYNHTAGLISLHFCPLLFTGVSDITVSNVYFPRIDSDKSNLAQWIVSMGVYNHSHPGAWCGIGGGEKIKKRTFDKMKFSNFEIYGDLEQLGQTSVNQYPVLMYNEQNDIATELSIMDLTFDNVLTLYYCR